VSNKKQTSPLLFVLLIAAACALLAFFFYHKKQSVPDFSSTSTEVANVITATHLPAGVKLASDQTFNVSIGAEVPTLDPQKIQDNVSARVADDLYESLVTENEEGDIVPGLAISWNLSSDSLVYTFQIRTDAKFSDGAPITADDVVFSIRRLVDPKVASPYSELITMVKNARAVIDGKEKLETLGIQALDKNTVQITLIARTPYFIKIMANPSLGIVEQKNVVQYGDQFTQPGKLVSSGAYVLKYWKVGDKITAVRNPNYWNNKETVVNTVNYFPISDANSEMQMYQAGQIDYTFDIVADKFKSLIAGQVTGITPREVNAHPYLANYYLDFNLNEAPFKNNPKLRQALSMAIDRDVLARDVTGRGELVSYDIVPNGTMNYTQQTYAWEKLSQAERVAEAKKLYQEAGYSKEHPLTLAFSYNTNILHKKVAVALASMWNKNLGVNVSLTNMEWKVFLAERQAGKYQSARDGWIADYNDPTSFLDLLKSTNPQNMPKYFNPNYDGLLQQAAVEADPKKRFEILQQASSVMMNDYPIAVLYNYVTTHLVKPYIGGYSGRNALDHQYTRDYYILAH